jgi:hypothetical protein
LPDSIAVTLNVPLKVDVAQTIGVAGVRKSDTAAPIVEPPNVPPVDGTLPLKVADHEPESP